jgi:hypothetical protein
MHWLESLSPNDRNVVLSVMRDTRTRSDYHHGQARKLSPRNGEISAGMAEHEEFCKGEALSVFLRELGKGSTPQQAASVAKETAADIIRIANARREYQVRRGEGMANGLVDDYMRRVLQAIA